MDLKEIITSISECKDDKLDISIAKEALPYLESYSELRDKVDGYINQARAKKIKLIKENIQMGE